MEAFIPAATLAAMVLFIKFPVIMLRVFVLTPIGIPLRKTLPVMRVSLVPRIPPLSIPVIRPDDVGRGIGVIRGPAIVIAEKVIEDPIQKPIPVVIGPRCIRPDPR
jgi:hypothetical protein